MGFDDTKPTWGEYGQQVLISLKSTGDSFTKMFDKSWSSSLDTSDSLGSDSSSDIVDVEDPSTRARRERKERRMKKKRG